MLDSDCTPGVLPAPKKENPGSKPYPQVMPACWVPEHCPHSSWRLLCEDKEDYGHHVTNSAVTNSAMMVCV